MTVAWMNTANKIANLVLPPYMLVVSFGTPDHGPIQIAPVTHRMSRKDALEAVESAEIASRLLPLEIGDVLIRHPWALHRGTPNAIGTPRALVTIPYVRRWYTPTRAARSIRFRKPFGKASHRTTSHDAFSGRNVNPDSSAFTKGSQF